LQKFSPYLFLCALLLGVNHHCLSQIDTVKAAPAKPQHSPKKAAIFSAVLPGLGQAYNKKWWKIPIVYAAIGTSTGFIVYNQRKFSLFKQAYITRLNGNPEDPTYEPYSTAQLFDIQDTYHNWRDISIVVTAAFYTLNILDAAVDAHFFRYNIDDDLSLEISPNLNFVKPGITLCLRF
jgi:Family of unknown function (DUF5683)